MPDLRYHVISLISVFLALAIGVLLGTAMADRGVISDQLQNEVTNIQDQLDDQRELIAEREEEINALKERTAAEQELMESMSQNMISDRLLGVNVALVTGPWADEEVAREMQKDLATAGVDLTSVKDLDPPDPAEVTGPDVPESEAPYVLAAREVAGLSGGVEGDGEVKVPEVVVFLGGGEIPVEVPEGLRQDLREAEAAMFEVWTEAGIRVVAAEPSTTVRTEVPLFQDAGIPSVDNADLPAGRAAVIECAATGCEGAYGTKPTASDVFPPAAS